MDNIERRKKDRDNSIGKCWEVFGIDKWYVDILHTNEQTYGTIMARFDTEKEVVDWSSELITQTSGSLCLPICAKMWPGSE